jgi:hypothetical protein
MGFDVVLPKPFSIERLGRALVEGRQRRGGNARFLRLPAHMDGGGATGAGIGLAAGSAGDALGAHHSGSGTGLALPMTAVSQSKRKIDAEAAAALAAAAFPMSRRGRDGSVELEFSALATMLRPPMRSDAGAGYLVPDGSDAAGNSGSVGGSAHTPLRSPLSSHTSAVVFPMAPPVQ